MPEEDSCSGGTSIGIRLLRYAWAAPVTLPGLLLLLLAALTGGRFRTAGGHLETWGGMPARLLGWTPTGAAAMALGHVIIGRTEEDLRRLRRHELAHVRQAETWGIFFLPAYLLASLAAAARGKHFYLDNRFERMAREAERGGPE